MNSGCIRSRSCKCGVQHALIPVLGVLRLSVFVLFFFLPDSITSGTLSLDMSVGGPQG